MKSNDGAAISFGRVDAFLDIYFERDLRTGVLASEDEAQEIIDNLVLKLRLVRHLRPKAYDEIFAGDPIWATNAIAGVLVDASGSKKHMVTKTSYRFLQTLVNLGAAPEPNMTVLFDESVYPSRLRSLRRISRSRAVAFNTSTTNSFAKTGVAIRPFRAASVVCDSVKTPNFSALDATYPRFSCTLSMTVKMKSLVNKSRP